MQRIFNKNQYNVFAGKSTNEQMISDLAKIFQNKPGPASIDISRLLFLVQTFLAQTDPTYQANRDKLITDEKVSAILEQPGSAMRDFQIKYKTPHNEEANNALYYCERALLDQLEILKKNNDKIYLYYASHDSSLKKMLNAYSKMSIKL